jgi:polyphosphate kinase
MPRNLYERVEVMFPVKNSALRKRIFDEILETYLKDTDKARVLHPDGTYGRANQANSRLSRNGRHFSAQGFFIELAEGKTGTESEDVTDPREHSELLAATA